MLHENALYGSCNKATEETAMISMLPLCVSLIGRL